MSNPIRLLDTKTGNRVVVDARAGKVYGADDRGLVSVYNRVKQSPDQGAALDAAKFIKDVFTEPFPGARSRDGRFICNGQLTQPEQMKWEKGQAVQASLNELQLHLKFFDTSNDGEISFKENYGGWRSLGFSVKDSAVKAASSGVVFGQVGEGLAIDLEGIGAKRKAGVTGIYDKSGKLDLAVLDGYLAEFDARGTHGSLTQDQLLAVVSERTKQGTVSKGQFRSLFEVCEKINGGEKRVTKDQFRALFEGSLLYLAASMTGDDGRRRI